jgi:hypothetical protein
MNPNGGPQILASHAERKRHENLQDIHTCHDILFCVCKCVDCRRPLGLRANGVRVHHCDSSRVATEGHNAINIRWGADWAWNIIATGRQQ